MYYRLNIYVIEFGQLYYIVLLDGKVYANKPVGVWCVNAIFLI